MNPEKPVLQCITPSKTSGPNFLLVCFCFKNRGKVVLGNGMKPWTCVWLGVDAKFTWQEKKTSYLRMWWEWIP